MRVAEGLCEAVTDEVKDGAVCRVFDQVRDERTDGECDRDEVPVAESVSPQSVKVGDGDSVSVRLVEYVCDAVAETESEVVEVYDKSCCWEVDEEGVIDRDSLMCEEDIDNEREYVRVCIEENENVADDESVNGKDSECVHVGVRDRVVNGDSVIREDIDGVVDRENEEDREEKDGDPDTPWDGEGDCEGDAVSEWEDVGGGDGDDDGDEERVLVTVNSVFEADGEFDAGADCEGVGDTLGVGDGDGENDVEIEERVGLRDKDFDCLMDCDGVYDVNVIEHDIDCVGMADHDAVGVPLDDLE